MENSDNSDIFFQQGIGIGPFQMMNEIGKGEFGKVYIGIHEETKEKVAIKQIQKSNEKVNMNSVRSEINIQKKLFHPYLCKMYCVIDIPDYIFIVTEYCSGGEILKTMEEQDAPFEERMACKIFTQVLSGIEYLHNNYICHRDIKLENMLFDENGDAKLTDFGLSKSFEGNITFDKAVGSALYSAPEVFTGKPYIGKNADLWSMGVCLYVMVCGEYPFKGDELDDFLKSLFNDTFDVPDSVSPEYKDLIYRILEKDPNKRLNIEQIKRHYWLHMFDFNFMKSPGIIINKDILPIDFNIVTEMVGYDEAKIRNLINDILINKHNNNTISYYLRIESLKRQKGLSISDIRPSSELFLIYIKDEKSKMKTYDNDINKKIDELVKNIINGHKMEQLKIREKIKSSLNIEKSKTINYKNNNKIINNNNVGDNNNNNKDNINKSVNNKIKMNYKFNALLSRTYRNFEDFKKMLKKDDEEKEKKVEKIKKNKFEIIKQYIGPLLLVHNIIDEIITNVVILKNTKEIKKRIIPVNNSSLNVLSTKPKNKFEPIIIENNNITITPLEKINLNSKFKNFSMDKIEEIEYLPNNTNTTMVKTFTNGFPKDRNEKATKSSKNIKFQYTERKMNIINEDDEIKTHKKINTIFSSENYRKGKNVNDTKNNNNNNGIAQRNERKRTMTYLKKNKSDLSCVLKNTNFSKVIKGFKEKIAKNGILKKNKKIKRNLSQKKTVKKINILYGDDEINKFLKERNKNRSEKIINKIKLFSIDIIEKKEKKSDLKYLYTNNEKNQRLLLSKRINRNQKPYNPNYANNNDNLDENLNINEISSEKKINRKKENNSMITKKEEQKFVRHKKNLYSSQIDFYNSKSNISINFDRKRTNTITLENSSRKNNNQGRTLLIKRNKNKKKEKINDESHNIPNTPHSTRRLGDIKTTIFSNTKNPKNACQTGRNQKKPENSEKTISYNDSVIKKKNDINDKNIKYKSCKSNSIHLKNTLAKKNEIKNDNNNIYEIKTKKNENLVKTIIVDYIGNNNTTISIIGKGQTKFSCKIFIGRKKVVCNIKMVQQEKNEYIITGEFIDGDIQSFEKIFEQIKEKLE
jgi:serine/threonine protein kinase